MRILGPSTRSRGVIGPSLVKIPDDDISPGKATCAEEGSVGALISMIIKQRIQNGVILEAG